MSKKSTTQTWLIIGACTLMLVGVTYFLFQRIEHSSNPLSSVEVPLKTTSSPHSSKFFFQQTPMPIILDSLAAHYNIEILLDNPFMEDCYVNLKTDRSPDPKKVLYQLIAPYKMEMHQTAPNEFLLIGGSCK